jgi:hypothetical protein
MKHATPIAIAVLLTGLLGQPAAAQTSGLGLTNADIARLVAARVSDQTVMTVIREATATQFDLSSRAVVELAGQEVSSAVIAAMRQAATKQRRRRRRPRMRSRFRNRCRPQGLRPLPGPPLKPLCRRTPGRPQRPARPSCQRRRPRRRLLPRPTPSPHPRRTKHRGEPASRRSIRPSATIVRRKVRS